MTDRSRLYESPQDFFALNGNAVMRLSPAAAASACEQAASRGIVVARVEGGIWSAPNFEARGDCIWDGLDQPVSQPQAAANNLAAAQFIHAHANSHSAFILTTYHFAGRSSPSTSAAP
ncbi:colicin immunity protein [Lysobacter lacus]|uniref:Colicin immunity protein n=1 Tax=Cognatilysobacter lacus TaxID=1643323 RepID=A0A5D8YLS9_9GAMM|nr:colicin immunity protein [Lysobacter lacus]